MKRNIHNTAKLAANQEGLVAITVTLLIMIVLTLIMTGFAQLARKEQREALDRQLAAQALYAAESGINEGRRLAKADPNLEKTTCPTNNSSLDGDLISISCLLIKQKLNNLTFSNVVDNRSTVTPIVPEENAGSVFDRLIVHWERSNSQGGQNILDPTGFRIPANRWGLTNVGVLRLELVPYISAASPQDSDSLRNKMFTLFAVPKRTLDPVNDVEIAYSDELVRQGKIVYGDCSSASNILKCKIVITGLNAKNYYLRMSSIYNTAKVDVCAGSAVSGQKCDENIVLTESQVEIDATGRANDVLKRVKVVTNKTPKYNGSRNTAEFNIDSADSLCKLYSVWPGGSQTGSCPNTIP